MSPNRPHLLLLNPRDVTGQDEEVKLGTRNQALRRKVECSKPVSEKEGEKEKNGKFTAKRQNLG